MSRTFVRNGTPVGTCSKCDSCNNAHIIRGYRESEVLVFCNYTYEQPIAVPFKVYECSNYQDKNRPGWEQMEKLAITVNPSSTLKPAGFRTAANEKRDEQEAASETEILTG